jgi:microcystin-dependent protein
VRPTGNLLADVERLCEQTGAQGPKGDKGDKGDTGEQGPQGEQGPAGDDGGSSWEFPIGYILISTVNTNPSTFLGYGTWGAFGAGRVLVGLDSGQTEFDTAEETGGAKTHTLTTAEMPSHTHVQDAHTHVQNAHTHTQDAHTHVITSQTATTGGATSYEHGTLDTSSAEAEATEVTGSTTATNQNTTAVNQNATAVNQNTGGGGAHNNLQPYIVVYFWERTA